MLQIAIVGKGLTFDSGGYNLKAGPGSMIELMKFDMGGSGATLGAARILADTKPEGVEVSWPIRVLLTCGLYLGLGGSGATLGAAASWQIPRQMLLR